MILDKHTIESQTEYFLSEFERSLANEIESLDSRVQNLLNFVLNNKGKRLRPLLVHSCCDIKNKHTFDDAINVSIIVELIHIATLIHDDVIDNADVRRNQATLHNIAKTNEAILVGDILFSHALEMASSFPDTMVCREVASAVKLTCMGEVSQSFAQCNYDTTLKEYQNILIGKTAKLFACACRLGARLSNQKINVIGSVERFAENLGLAYQLYDDTIDLFGSESNSSKTLKTDLKTGKVTLPVILLLQSCCEEERKPIIDMLSSYDASADKLNEIFEAYSIKQKCCDIIADKINEIRNCIANVSFLPIADKMKNISENVCNKIQNTII
jgi:octaprenyl-diphosphate synthase